MPYLCKCGNKYKKVVDSRQSKFFIRRRRQCPCGNRITTVEINKNKYEQLVQIEEVMNKAYSLIKEK